MSEGEGEREKRLALGGEPWANRSRTGAPFSGRSARRSLPLCGLPVHDVEAAGTNTIHDLVVLMYVCRLSSCWVLSCFAFDIKPSGP